MDGASHSAVPNEEGRLFEQRHSYIHVKVSLSEPLAPLEDTTVLPQSKDIAKKAVNNMPGQFPSVIDAVTDYQNSVYAVVREISVEYSRMFAAEDEGPSALSTIKSASQNAHQREVREGRKEKFLIEFNSSQRYMLLRQKLKKAIFRLAVEKFNKEVDHNGLQTKIQKEKFKSELYTFLQEQMKIFLN